MNLSEIKYGDILTIECFRTGMHFPYKALCPIRKNIVFIAKEASRVTSFDWAIVIKVIAVVNISNDLYVECYIPFYPQNGEIIRRPNLKEMLELSGVLALRGYRYNRKAKKLEKIRKL